MNSLHKIVVLLVVIALASAGTAFAQAVGNDEPALLSFQGRVGAMYTGGEPFENGATFEVGAMYRFTGPIHLHVFGGLTNFDKEGDIVALTPEFADTLAGFQENYTITDINRLNYKTNYFGGGLAFVQDLGSVELILNGGAAAYHVEFVADFDYVPNGIPVEAMEAFTQFLSLQDKEWFYGYTVGGGLYYDFNEIISFGGHVNYHAIDTDAIEDLVSFTFGMHIKVP